MEFIHLMTNLGEHRKWLETSGNAAKVLINLWLYCGRQETDGHIPSGAARREGLTGRLAGELEQRGWIHRNGDGWYVHDWHHYQVSAEEIRAERERTRALARERKRRQRHGEVTRDTGGTDA